MRYVFSAATLIELMRVNQGWTKFTTFADLDAMDESEWDKVLLPFLFTTKTPK
jgi:hypothetical protein